MNVKGQKWIRTKTCECDVIFFWSRVFAVNSVGTVVLKYNPTHYAKKKKYWCAGGKPNVEFIMSFLFLYFSKNLQKYIFGFRFYNSIPLPPGRKAVGTYI